MPSNIEPVSFYGVHSVVDSNYIQWSICNSCANKNWATSIKCICGHFSHESDMIPIPSKHYTWYVNKKSHPDCWHKLNDISPAEDNENIVLHINKLCRDCSTLSGAVTPYGQQIFDNILNNDDCSNLSASNIVHHENVVSKQIKVYSSPSVFSYIKNHNSANLGYAIPYSQLF